MRITPWTPESVLRRMVRNTYQLQASGALLGAVNVYFVIFFYNHVSAIGLCVAAINVVGAYTAFRLFNSAGRLRTSLWKLIAVKRGEHELQDR